MPGWGRSHMRFALLLTVALALLLRVSYHQASTPESSLVDRHLPVAAAIGLVETTPGDAALPTWINTGVYSVGLYALSLTHPNLSAADYATAFMSDPDGFCVLARFATLFASAMIVCLIWVLGSTLIDRSTGIAAAFIFAVHPAAVAFTAPINSGAFALLLILAALLAVARLDWSRAGSLRFAAIGLTLGLAVESMPVATVVFILVLCIGIQRTAQHNRDAVPTCIAVAVSCFCVAAAAVISSTAALSATAESTFAGALVVGCLIAAGYALSALRELLGAAKYSTTVLSVGMAVALVTITVFSPAEPELHSPPAYASDWMVRYLPAETVVIVHSDLARAITLPRTARSIQREVAGDSGFYTGAAVRAAEHALGPRYDVIFGTSRRPLSDLLTQPPHAGAVDYLVLPDDVDPRDLHPREAFWLVARFGSSPPDGSGVVIWGTEASPQATPVHVEWRRDGSHRLAALPTP
ncbi:MAG: hypothetical protein ACQER1_18045 [Armatimonadota bacterium]